MRTVAVDCRTGTQVVRSMTTQETNQRNSDLLDIAAFKAARDSQGTDRLSAFEARLAALEASRVVTR